MLFSKAIVQAEWEANAPLREAMAIKRERLLDLRAKRAAERACGVMRAYGHDWADLLAQQEADQEQKQLDQREANRTRLRPPHLIRSGRSEYSSL